MYDNLRNLNLEQFIILHVLMCFSIRDIKTGPKSTLIAYYKRAFVWGDLCISVSDLKYCTEQGFESIEAKITNRQKTKDNHGIIDWHLIVQNSSFIVHDKQLLAGFSGCMICVAHLFLTYTYSN